MSDGDAPTRVCLLINQLAPGGAPTLLLELVRHTEKTAVEYTVCFLEGDDTLVPEFEAEGVEVVDLGAAFKFDPRAVWRLFRFLRGRDVDVLHTHLPYADTVGRVTGRLAGVPHVLSTKHNFPERFHPLTRLLEHTTRPLDTCTVANSEDVQDAFIEREFRGGHDWRTIYNGIDVDSFRDGVQAADARGIREQWGIGEDDFVVLNVARYNSAKGQRHLIDAANQVLERRQDTHVLIVGWGELESDLRNRVQELDLEEHVSVTGRVPSVEAFYATADVFALPSTIEGFGIVLLEAMAAGLPVVASDIPGAREVVADGETGLLVPPADPRALASAILAMSDDVGADEFGQRGYERALAKFDIRHVVEAHVELYREFGV